MEWLLISSAIFVLILLGVGIYQFLWRNIRDFFREVGILLRNMSVNFFQREVEAFCFSVGGQIGTLLMQDKPFHWSIAYFPAFFDASILEVTVHNSMYPINNITSINPP